MKSFASTSFFLQFDEILHRDKPKDAADMWTTAGITWHRSRHAFETHGYGFTIETYEIAKPGRVGWSLLVAKEYWWAGGQGEAIRSTRWAKPMRGNRLAIVAWFKEQQRNLTVEHTEDSS